MRRMFVIVLGLAIGAGALSARADDANKLKIAHEVVEVAHTADNMRKMMPQFMAQMKPMMMQQGTADATAVDAFIKRFSTHFDEAAGRFADLAAEIYAREFSEEDLANLLAFYKTPTGQNLLAKQPAISQAMFTAGSEWGKLMAKQVIEEFQKEKDSAPPKL